VGGLAEADASGDYSTIDVIFSELSSSLFSLKSRVAIHNLSNQLRKVNHGTRSERLSSGGRGRNGGRGSVDNSDAWSRNSQRPRNNAPRNNWQQRGASS